MSRFPARVALVTCPEVPAADPDTQRLIGPLSARGIAAAPVVWSDPAVDWDRYDLAIVRSCWDYCSRRDEFLAWAARVPRLANPAPVLEWNTDKRYLRELAAAGVPVVPTTWLAPGDPWDPPGTGTVVVKPAVSLCGLDTGRYLLGLPAERRLALEHRARLARSGRTAMVQPYFAKVESLGETSLVYLGGRFSHAVRKGAMLDGPDRGLDRRFASGGGAPLWRCRARPAELAIAERVLELVPGGRDRLLYARIDLVPDHAGDPHLMEVELAEPELFFRLVRGAAERFAGLVAYLLAGALRPA